MICAIIIVSKKSAMISTDDKYDVWNDYVNFRDYLNSHEMDAIAYSDLKQALAKQIPDDREANIRSLPP